MIGGGYYGIGPDGWPTLIPAAIPPEYPRDCMIYCTGCGVHYMIVVKAANDFAKCPTDETHKLGESAVTKQIADTEKKRK